MAIILISTYFKLQTFSDLIVTYILKLEHVYHIIDVPDIFSAFY